MRAVAAHAIIQGEKRLNLDQKDHIDDATRCAPAIRLKIAVAAHKPYRMPEVEFLPPEDTRYL